MENLNFLKLYSRIIKKYVFLFEINILVLDIFFFLRIFLVMI